MPLHGQHISCRPFVLQAARQGVRAQREATQARQDAGAARQVWQPQRADHLGVNNKVQIAVDGGVPTHSVWMAVSLICLQHPQLVSPTKCSRMQRRDTPVAHQQDVHGARQEAAGLAAAVAAAAADRSELSCRLDEAQVRHDCLAESSGPDG